MSDKSFGLDDLSAVLRESAGLEEGIDLDEEILDVTFGDLGYDSLALLETVAVIARQYGVPLDDDALGESVTPRDLIDLVNTENSGRAT